MKKLIILLLCISSGCVTAQDVIDLSGTWKLTSRLEATSMQLPGSLLTNGIGDDVTTDTRWTGSLYDSSFYFNPFMEPYRRAGQMKFPFFLTPKKHFVGEVTYSRSVNVPKAWKRQRVTLFLERPHIETTVVVNGHEVGHQMSLSAPHQYDVTPYLRFGGDNEISIRVYNGIENVCVGQDSHSVTDQTQGNWNGIAGAIELRATPIIYKRRVTTDLATNTAHITINELTYDVVVPNAKPWSEHSPQLYTAKVSYHGTPVRITFGFREVSIQGRDILLNGQRIHLRGTVENCCFPETGYPPTDTISWMRILSKCKEYGLNHVRFHSYCPPDAAFAAADRLGLYLQPEGPSWPNHGVKLGNGMSIDNYLKDECRTILDNYGHHPSLIMLAAGNEPAGNWVAWGVDFVKEMKAYDPSRIYCTASVGGGWEWDRGSEYHVKGGARGLEWNQRHPSSDDNFTAQIQHPRNFRGERNDEPLISHEQGQWCAFPDFREIPQYHGAYKACNFEIFRDLLAANGMAAQAEKFLMASGQSQVLAYKYEIERHLRTPHYAGFQLLSLNDYSGQGTALVGPLNVHWHEKGYCNAAEWREFCSDVVPLAALPRFTYSTSDTIRAHVLLYNMSGTPISRLSYTINNGERILAEGQCQEGTDIVFMPRDITSAQKLTLTLTAGGHNNHWNLWVYPDEPASATNHQSSIINHHSPLITSSLDSALNALADSHDVLLCAAGRIRYGADVVHRFLPVFWNTSWFKMKPPHTTGAYIQANHPVFRNFPTDDWQDLQWWELTNRAQCINLAEFPKDYQPIVQPIDTWHLSRKLGMMVEARVGNGRLLLTTLDIENDLDRRIVARQLRQSILSYMASEDFQPSLKLDPEILHHLFERDAPAVNMFTNDSPDELKPKLSN